MELCFRFWGDSSRVMNPFLVADEVAFAVSIHQQVICGEMRKESANKP